MRFGFTNKQLDKMINSTDPNERKMVALDGRPQDLNILVHDEDYGVRAYVARQGRDKDLDILVHDEEWRVRRFVAKYGRPEDLDILVHDKDFLVRYEVAKRGREKDLKILLYDEMIPVSHEAVRQIRHKPIKEKYKDNNKIKTPFENACWWIATLESCSDCPVCKDCEENITNKKTCLEEIMHYFSQHSNISDGWNVVQEIYEFVKNTSNGIKEQEEKGIEYSASGSLQVAQIFIENKLRDVGIEVE